MYFNVFWQGKMQIVKAGIIHRSPLMWYMVTATYWSENQWKSNWFALWPVIGNSYTNREIHAIVNKVESKAGRPGPYILPWGRVEVAYLKTSDLYKANPLFITWRPITPIIQFPQYIRQLSNDAPLSTICTCVRIVTTLQTTTAKELVKGFIWYI